ncbi:two-component system response regulator [Methyloversatilis sp.]|uniref:response regulator n=1 Tax=Methyloversatilis sp. TaxID=2569862 RepID=UPI002736E047|nr:response regulator [Methyloversatilis sp.]MDP2868453.1 response regulator [Methyloversatilis sp.]MDP3288956.1 response regulator [Methyloversatilis sp.]MDP3454673.1 response regulator [Methyloversatilis sp.]MDP3579281.1 response regulator [Methyloversatilis sp.]
MTKPLLRTIMLIDDSEADNFFHGLLLERSGLALRLEVFEWAEKALVWFADNPRHDVDLVLLDINMPRMDGFEFLDRFHLLPDEHKGDARICMLSSSPLDHERERAMGYPRVADFIVKPLESEILPQLARVRTIR